MSVIKYDEIDNKKILYHKPEKRGNYYYAPITYNNSPFYIQSSKLNCKDSIESCLSRSGNNLEVETMNHDYSFYDFMLNLDDKNIKETFKNNKNWFNKEIPLDIIDDMYKRLSKAIKKDSKPKFSFKVPVLKEKPQCSIFDSNKICIDHQKINEGTEVILILHIRGLKFLKSNYYCDCYISQIKAFVSKENKYSIFNQCLINDDEDFYEDETIIDEEFIQELKEKEKQDLYQKEKERNLLKKEIEGKKEDLKKLEMKLNEIK